MTLKDKRELIIHLELRLTYDINKKIYEYEDDIYNMDNFDIIMSNILKKQSNIKTIKDLLELEEYYDKLKRWFLHNEFYYIYAKYLDVDYQKVLENFYMKKELKDCDMTDIFNIFTLIRNQVNNEIKSINVDFLFKDFYDYVDKVWEEL